MLGPNQGIGATADRSSEEAGLHEQVAALREEVRVLKAQLGGKGE